METFCKNYTKNFDEYPFYHIGHYLLSSIVWKTIIRILKGENGKSLGKDSFICMWREHQPQVKFP